MGETDMLSTIEYTYDMVRDMDREMAILADIEEHEKRKPRATKYQTSRFYNFPKKSKGRRCYMR